MPRRVMIRSRQLNTDVAQLEELTKSIYRDILKQHLEELEDCADYIQELAVAVVPLDTGKLQASINVRVSKSNRYPGIIAHASAKDHGFDYALIQEENEDFAHTELRKLTEHGKPVEVDSDRIAHYLGGPFASVLDDLFKKYGVDIELPDNLQHAKEYYESGGDT